MVKINVLIFICFGLLSYGKFWFDDYEIVNYFYYFFVYNIVIILVKFRGNCV